MNIGEYMSMYQTPATGQAPSCVLFFFTYSLSFNWHDCSPMRLAQ